MKNVTKFMRKQLLAKMVKRTSILPWGWVGRPSKKRCKVNMFMILKNNFYEKGGL
jgi:hypothetical protein